MRCSMAALGHKLDYTNCEELLEMWLFTFTALGFQQDSFNCYE